MDLRLIDNNGLQRWLTAILESGGRLFMPLTSDGLTFYREVQAKEDIHFDAFEQHRGKPYYSLKELLFPISEPVLRYQQSNGEFVIEDLAQDRNQPDDSPASSTHDIIVFGATPCDAAAVQVFDHVFLTGEVDPFYAARRSKMVIIGMSCTQAQPECFCTAVGLSPMSSKGCDLLCTPLEPDDETLVTQHSTQNPEAKADILVEIFTSTGKNLLENVQGNWREPSTRDEVQHLLMMKSLLNNRVQQTMVKKTALSNATVLLQRDFESPVWEDIGKKCLGCGVCAYVCPTCHCFDLADEYDVCSGCRYKNWDSCCFAHFTLHASGHNPRPTQLERYRQRVMHKFCYFLEEAGINMCVGCGRCTKFCPVGIDIYEVRARWQ